MAGADCLKVRTERIGAVHVLVVSGDLATGSCASFTEAVGRAEADSASRVVVDLSGVKFVDAFGASALVAVISPTPGQRRVVLRSLRPSLRLVVTALIPDLDLTGSGLLMARPAEAAEVDPGGLTWALVRESAKARGRARRAITDTRCTAQMIAATEDKIAATLLQLAPQRSGAYDDVVALSQLARRHASDMRDHAGDAAPRDILSSVTADRGDTASGTLQRAIAFIHKHAHDDIRAADIAAAAHVTTRAVQLAFRHSLATTPLGYLRQVRLERAHRELIAAHPARKTVTMIAADWQFTNLGRFTALYRATYGVLPSHTLHDGKTAAALQSA